MMEHLANVWLPRLLFGVSLMLAATLLLLVVLAPWLANGRDHLLELLAHDTTLRRTMIVSAIGLAATAAIFFRPRGMASPSNPPKA